MQVLRLRLPNRVGAGVSSQAEWTTEDVVDAILEDTAKTARLLEGIDRKLLILLWITAIPWVLLGLGVVLQVVSLVSDQPI